MSTVYPTHTCFDDAIDIMVEFAQSHPAAITMERITLVHAICQMDDGQDFSHAWVESKHLGRAYFKGLQNGRKELFECDAKSYRKDLKAREITEYDYSAMVKENYRHATYGPWEKKYIDLCRKRRD